MNMDLGKRLEEFRTREKEFSWEGNFSEYYEMVTRNPGLARLSHARVYDMIMAAGAASNGDGLPNYDFFNQEVFGLEKSLQQIVEYFQSAAQRLEVRKRILLLMGPVGGGKSTIVYLIKKGLEEYTRTPEGAVYVIKG